MNLGRLGEKLSTLEKALSSSQGRRIWRVQPLEIQMAEEIDGKGALFNGTNNLHGSKGSRHE